MSFSPPLQIFLLSILLGAFLGIFWDINRVLKLKKTTKRFVFALDVIFFLIACAATITFFYIFTFAGFRGFIILGEIIGFILYYCTIEKPIFMLISTITNTIFFIYKFLFKIFNKISNFLVKVISNSVVLILKIIKIKKILNFFSKKFKKNTCFSTPNKCIIKKIVKLMEKGEFE